MKALYINLDPYPQAVADWLNAGKPGTVPHFDPLPLAVTIPLGETAVFFLQTGTFADGAAKINAWGDNDIGWTTNPSSIVDDTTPGSGTGGEASGVAFSSILQSQKTYWGHIGGATSFGATASVWDSEDNEIAIIPFTVLVRREQASGPVDTVDFTPPAAAPSAADIKSALVAAGEGALEGVDITGAKYPLSGAEISADYQYGISNEVLPGQTAAVKVREGNLLLIRVYRDQGEIE